MFKLPPPTEIRAENIGTKPARVETTMDSTFPLKLDPTIPCTTSPCKNYPKRGQIAQTKTPPTITHLLHKAARHTATAEQNNKRKTP